jgi:AraC family transcriptional regulator
MRLRFHAADEEHSHRVGPSGARCLNIELSDAWHESLIRFGDVSDRPILVESGGWWALQAAALHRDGTPDSQLMLESLAAEMLVLCERQSRIELAVDRSAAIRRAIAAIDDRLGHQLSLTDLALVAGLHPTHFARSFRKLTGLTVGEYIRHRRVARAQALMIAMPSAGISRIAAETGFADHAHLTRTFRQISGTIPSAYRAALEEERFIS